MTLKERKQIKRWITRMNNLGTEIKEAISEAPEGTKFAKALQEIQTDIHNAKLSAEESLL